MTLYLLMMALGPYGAGANISLEHDLKCMNRPYRKDFVLATREQGR